MAAVQRDNLALEFRQFQFVERLFENLRRAVRQEGVPVEKIFGRWLQSVQHFNPPEANDRYRLLPRRLAVNEQDGSRAELTQMLHQSLYLDAEAVDAVTNELFDMIRQFLDEADDALPDAAAEFAQNDNGGQIMVGAFSTENCPRVRFLANRFGVDATALVCLRYTHLSKFLGGESGMSVTGLNALHDIGMATFEGFASPLNCRLLGREGVKFCSLFEDTDAAFGSLGNFFRVDLTDNPGGWILSPPFVEPVLDATADRVLRTLDDTEPGRFWFYITFPHWSDNTGWQALDQSPMKVARIDCKEGSFISQDCYGGFLRPSYAICVFMLGQLPDSVNLIALREQLCCTDEESIRKDWRDACDCGMADYGQF